MKPCKFCGEDNELKVSEYGYGDCCVICLECWARGPVVANKEEAIKAWDRGHEVRRKEEQENIDEIACMMGAKKGGAK